MSLEAALLVDSISNKVKTIDEVTKILYNKELIDTDIVDLVVVVFAVVDPDSLETQVEELLKDIDSGGASFTWEIISELDLQEDEEEEYKGLTVAWVRPSAG